MNNSRNSKDSNANIDNPVKKCHYLEGKHFIVFDESILQKAGIIDDELYFLQEITDDGCIILRPYRLKESNDR